MTPQNWTPFIPLLNITLPLLWNRQCSLLRQSSSSCQPVVRQSSASYKTISSSCQVSKRSIERQIGQQVVLQSGLAIFTVGTLMFSVHRNLNLEIGDVYELKCDINIFWTHFVASGQMTHRAAQRMTIIIIFVRVLTATMGWNKHFVQNKSFSAFCEIWRVLKGPYPDGGTEKTRNAGMYEDQYSPSCGGYVNHIPI